MKAFTLFCLGIALVYGMCSAAMWRVQNPHAPLVEFFTAAQRPGPTAGGTPAVTTRPGACAELRPRSVRADTCT